MTHYDDDRKPRRRDADADAEEQALARRESLIERRLRAARGEQVEEHDADEPDDDDEYDDEPRYRRQRGYALPARIGCAQALLYITLGVITVAVVSMLLGRQIFDDFTKNLTQSVPDQVRQVVATPTPTVRDRGGTILQIQALNRIETLRFSVERVVEAGTETGDWRDMLLGEKLLLIASGDVVAGVDLSRLRATDVNISPDGTSITIKLPPSEIFSAALNNQRTRVYDRDTRLGTQLTGGEDPTLETQARQAAEGEILNAACEGDIMRRSADEAKRSMEQFLRLLNFESVTVIAEPGPCVAPAAAKTP
jgi:Protein of unknown function (DUF4230)